MTEDRVPDPVYILGEATRRPITLDEYEVVRSALRSAQPAPPLDLDRLEDAMLAHAAHVTATEGLHSGCTFDCAADILARLGSDPSRSEPE